MILEEAKNIKLGDELLVLKNMIEIMEDFYDNYHPDMKKFIGKVGTVIRLEYITRINNHYEFQLNFNTDDDEKKCWFSNECLLNIANLYKPKMKNENHNYIREAANLVTYNNKLLHYNDQDAMAFGIDSNTNKVHISDFGKEHKDMYFFQHFRGQTKNEGRLWLDSKLISFYTPYPEPTFLTKYLDKIKKLIKEKHNIDVDFNNSDWVVDLKDLKEELKKQNKKIDNIPDFGKLIDYNYYYDNIKHINIPKAKYHTMSPLNKEKHVEYGYGSKNPKYMNKRKWQQASLTDESYIKSFSDFNKNII